MLSWTVGVPQSYTHWFYFVSVRINLSMKSVSSDSSSDSSRHSKLLICSVCFSINFSSLVKLSVFCRVGTLFSECSLWVFELFKFPCAAWA